MGRWQRSRRVVSQLQNGQRAPDFLLHFTERERSVCCRQPDSEGASRTDPPSSYLQMVRASLLIAAFLILCPTCAEALGDMGICYILDGILILYGIVLTVLYCRLRIHSNKPPPAAQKQPAEGGIYAGLYSPSNDTYETIGRDKKPIV